MEPFAYYFNGRLYKSLEELKGRTFSEDNKPMPLYTQQQLNNAWGEGFTEGSKEAADDIFSSYNLRR